MAAVLKESRIGLAGGRRIGIDEMAKDPKAREELEELLVLLDAIDESESPIAADANAHEPAASDPKVKPTGHVNE